MRCFPKVSGRVDIPQSFFLEAGREVACSERVLGHLFINDSRVKNCFGCWVIGLATAGVPCPELGACKREALPLSFVNIFLAHK